MGSYKHIEEGMPVWIAGIQTLWMDLSLPSMALDARIPAGMTALS